MQHAHSSTLQRLHEEAIGTGSQATTVTAPGIQEAAILPWRLAGEPRLFKFGEETAALCVLAIKSNCAQTWVLKEPAFQVSSFVSKVTAVHGVAIVPTRVSGYPCPAPAVILAQLIHMLNVNLSARATFQLIQLLDAHRC